MFDSEWDTRRSLADRRRIVLQLLNEGVRIRAICALTGEFCGFVLAVRIRGLSQ